MFVAIQYAINEKRSSVTLVHKGNIMKFTEGAFKNWGYEVAEQEFGDKVFTWAEYDRIVEKMVKMRRIKRWQTLKWLEKSS